jgi:methyl coenzyme M reductase alpha subunit
MVQANGSLPKFAKRHYEAIATAIQEARRRANGSNDPIAVVVDELADIFAADNSRFGRDRFERACVPGANVRARS